MSGSMWLFSRPREHHSVLESEYTEEAASGGKQSVPVASLLAVFSSIDFNRETYPVINLKHHSLHCDRTDICVRLE